MTRGPHLPRPIALLWLLTLAGVMAAVAAFTVARQQFEELAQAKSEHNRLAAELIGANRRRQESVSQSNSSARPQAAVGAGDNRRAARVRNAVKAQSKKYDPQGELKRAAAARLQLEEKYRPLVRALKLTDEQANQLIASIAQVEEAQREVLDAASAQGVSVASLEYQNIAGQLLSGEASSAQKDQTALLGASGYAQLLDYQRQLPLRSGVGEIAGAEAIAGTPLTSDQVEQLMSVVAQASTSYQSGQSAAVQDVDWSTAGIKAAAVLTPAQLAVFTGSGPGGSLLASRVWSHFNQTLYHTLFAENGSDPAKTP